MKKVIALLLAALLCFSLAACGGGSSSTSAPAAASSAAPADSTADSAASGSAPAAEGTKSPEDFDKFIIGVAETQANDETVTRRKYLETYIAPRYNVEFIFSEMLQDTDAERTFIENCADAGADAIMGFRYQDADQMAIVCEQYGMLYTVQASSYSMENLFAAAPDIFLGANSADNPAVGADYASFLLNNASEDGSEGFVICSVLASSNNEKHYYITSMALEALQEQYDLTYEKSIDELTLTDTPMEVVNDKGLNIYIYPGSANKDNWLPGISALLQTGKYGMMISCGLTYSSTAVVVDEVEKSFDIDIKVASIGSLGESLTSAFNTPDTFGNPSLDMAVVNATSLIGSALFVMTYNGLTGYDNLVHEADGTSPLDLKWRQWAVYPDQIGDMEGWEAGDPDMWVADYDFVDSALGIYNPDLTVDEIKTQFDSYTLEHALEVMGQR